MRFRSLPGSFSGGGGISALELKAGIRRKNIYGDELAALMS